MVILAATVVVVVAVAVQEHQVLGRQGLRAAAEATVFPLQLQVKICTGLVAGVVDHMQLILALEMVVWVAAVEVLWEPMVGLPWARAAALP
jgi:hypothetical protein